LTGGVVQVDASARPRRKLRPGCLRDDANFSRSLATRGAAWAA
jgi:hypothetical protein